MKVTVVSGCNAFYAQIDEGGPEVTLGDGVDRYDSVREFNEEQTEMPNPHFLCDDLDDPLFCTQWASELSNDQEWLDFMVEEE